MPTYEYICKNCGHKFEKFHSMRRQLKVCPKCHKKFLVRLIGAGSGIIFKGWFPGQEIARKEAK